MYITLIYIQKYKVKLQSLILVVETYIRDFMSYPQNE